MYNLLVVVVCDREIVRNTASKVGFGLPLEYDHGSHLPQAPQPQPQAVLPS
jgi:hypothetical protein